MATKENIAGSKFPPDTSFTIQAPVSSALAATLARKVSTEIKREGNSFTSASKDESMILDKLVNYTFFSDPLGVKSNNGYIAASIGIVQKGDSQNILREFRAERWV